MSTIILVHIEQHPHLIDHQEIVMASGHPAGRVAMFVAAARKNKIK